VVQRQKTLTHLVAGAALAVEVVDAGVVVVGAEEEVEAAVLQVLREMRAQWLHRGEKRRTRAVRPTTTVKRSVARRWREEDSLVHRREDAHEPGNVS
jgi:hypothetical protein